MKILAKIIAPLIAVVLFCGFFSSDAYAATKQAWCWVHYELSTGESKNEGRHCGNIADEYPIEDAIELADPPNCYELTNYKDGVNAQDKDHIVPYKIACNKLPNKIVKQIEDEKPPSSDDNDKLNTPKPTSNDNTGVSFTGNGIYIRNTPQSNADQNQLKNIIRIVLGIFGAIAVLVITIAGFLYITSNGDPQKTARAKDAILYAVIGLAVTIVAEVLVQLVMGQV